MIMSSLYSRLQQDLHVPTTGWFRRLRNDPENKTWPEEMFLLPKSSLLSNRANWSIAIRFQWPFMMILASRCYSKVLATANDCSCTPCVIVKRYNSPGKWKLLSVPTWCANRLFDLLSLIFLFLNAVSSTFNSTDINLSYKFVFLWIKCYSSELGVE